VSAALRSGPGGRDGRADRGRRGGPGSAPGRLGGILVVEVGLAVALGLVALGPGLLPLAGVVLSAALVAGLVRARGELVGTWAVLALRHRFRARDAPAADGAAADPDEDREAGGLDLGPLDAALGEVVVVDGRDHDGRRVAFAGGDDGTWSAVLVPDAEQLALLLDPSPAGPEAGPVGGFPLAALAGTLSDRGVVLDALTVVRHVRPGGVDSPARQAHREVLGPLADAAHRSAWLVVRLDPDRCPGAVAERGGGVLGARRALVGALARISRVLADRDLPVQPLDREGLRDAVATAAATDLDAASGSGGVTERWDAVVVGEVGHATWDATDLRIPSGTRLDLDDLMSPDAATTVALALRPDQADPGGGPTVAVAARVRVSARTPDELAAAGRAVVAAGRARGLRLEPRHGRQAAALRATLPYGGSP